MRRSSRANDSPSHFVARGDVAFRKADGGAQFREGEGVAEAFEGVVAEVVRQAEFLKLPLEQRLFVQRVGDLARLGEKANRGRDLDPLIGIDDTGTKRDRRDVPFPSGAQAKNEPQSAGGESGLVGMRHDGRIE